ncbi:MAG: acyl-CoA synthetase FdrA [Holophagales bacterium]|nr:acyl-CoA synthetase FdrA [Holophagales bacterium]
MTHLRATVRRGAYHDSIVLMQLQATLLDLDGVRDAGVAMGTAANLSMLEANGLLPRPAPEVGSGDLLVAVLAEGEEQASDALGQVDALLARRASGTEADEYRYRSLRAAVRAAPDARWVVVSVPGSHAARVSRQALDGDRNVFLYSDNVPLEEEQVLKTRAARSGLLVLGPDCGTAIVGGTGLGFANRVRRGDVGLVAASGTGLQAVASRVHAAGAGISHALGTGGRDLSDTVGGATTLRALDLLERDPATRVIVLVSKPPSPAVAARILGRARRVPKPVVVAFLGYPPPAARLANLHFARDLDDAADLASSVASDGGSEEAASAWRSVTESAAAPVSGRFVRGLFSGGTLAYQALLALRPFLLPSLASNLRLDGVTLLDDPHRSLGHTIVDLGEDALTVGRLHPMMDADAARRRLEREAADPETAVILLDVVLGDVAHADPAAELVPALEAVRTAGGPAVVALLVGTDEDPQGADGQAQRLEAAGALVERSVAGAVERVLERIPTAPEGEAEADTSRPARLEDLDGPLSVINVGLDLFHHSLRGQGADSLQVDWRPPAGGDARLMEILEKVRS